jgi:hypothetical protein
MLIYSLISLLRLSRAQRVDGLIVWDMVCGTIGRPCPKLAADPTRFTTVGPFNLPPPCIYLFPDTAQQSESRRTIDRRRSTPKRFPPMLSWRERRAQFG